jgi:hypothetical protein
MTSSPVFGDLSVNTSWRPSGDTPDAYCTLGLSVKRSTAPVPSVACEKRVRAPVRSDVKMMRRPSGVQTG